MKQMLSEFQPVEGVEHVYSAQKGALRCVAILLTDGALCLYSPVAGLGDTALSSLAAVGRVKMLLAPNHYHNRAVGQFSKAFPDAKLVCTETARPRLEKVTGLSFQSPDCLDGELPGNVVVRMPDGLKTGELWFRVQIGRGLAWIVTDAFRGPAGSVGEVADELQMMGTFPGFGVKHAETYKHWIAEEVECAPPDLIIPCHGSMIRAANLAVQVRHLVEQL